MGSRSKLPVPPLGEARLSRIEDSVIDRLRESPPPQAAPMVQEARRFRWRPAVALVLAGAAAAVLGGVGLRGVFMAQPAPTATVTAIHPSRVTAGHAGSRVDVGESTLDLDPETDALVSGDDAQGILVDLERGSVDVEVAPRRGRPAYVVRAGDVSVRVIGTHFRVTRRESGASVEVARGVVEVSAPGAAAELTAGERWSWPSEGAQAPAAPQISPPPEPAPPTAAVPSTQAAPAKAAAPRGATPMDRYNEAAQLEGSHPDEALAIYRDVAAGNGPWAMNALFAEGRLEADRGDPSVARRLLSNYLARFPQGPNAEDARRLLDRIP